MPDLQADFETVAQPIPFKIFSGLLKAQLGPDGKMRLRGVASSTIKDRHGDTMAETALRDMERAANENLTIFLNHSYNVPEDVAGSVESAAMVQRSFDDAGAPIWDIDFDVVINSANPRAVDAWKAIDEGTKLGLSIGAMIPEGGAVRNKKTGSYVFNHVDLLETSIVGIPANPRSWVQNAVKALKSATTMQLGAPTISLDDDGNYEIKGRLAEGQVRLSTPEGEFGIGTVDVVDAMCGADCAGGSCKKPKGHDGEHSSETGQNNQSADPEDPHQDDPDEDADEPTETPGDVEPEESKAKIQVITIDTDDPSEGSAGSQEAAPSDPGTEPDDDVYDSAQPEDLHLTALQAGLDTVELLLGQLTQARTDLEVVRQERDAARRESEESASLALRVLEETSLVIEKMAAMPVGRKAIVRDAVSSVSAIERAYGPEIAKLIGR